MQRKMHAFLKRIAISTAVQTYHLERPWRPPTYSAAREYFRAMMGGQCVSSASRL
jgi:hypothetical protein